MVRIGLLEEELYAPQDLLVSLEVESDFSQIATTDEVEDGTDYRDIVETIRSFSAGSSLGSVIIPSFRTTASQCIFCVKGEIRMCGQAGTGERWRWESELGLSAKKMVFSYFQFHPSQTGKEESKSKRLLY